MKAGALIHFDVLNPKATKVELKLPELDLHLDAKADHWLYKVLPKALAPLVRGALQTFGSRMLEKKLTECLEDPSCPHSKGKTLELLTVPTLRAEPERANILV